MDISAEQLRDLVDGFLQEHPEITPTVFGRVAVKDPKFVFDLRKGRECRSATRQKVVDFIERHASDADEAAA